jgi:2,3-bisphosphoglycerate-dependent phosphoglycerate mutase/probable phosphoglycerate mutase
LPDGENPSCDLWLIRHAESEHNADGRVQGWLDSPLTAWGRRQARQAGLHLAADEADGGEVAAIVASDLRRAADTATLIAEGLGWDPASVRFDARLREYDTGVWSGLTPREIDEHWPGQLTRWRERELAAPPSGETRAAFAARAREALQDVVRDHPGERVLIVTHGGVLRMVERFVGAPPRQLANLTGRRIRAFAAGGFEALEPLDLGDPDTVGVGEPV